MCLIPLLLTSVGAAGCQRSVVVSTSLAPSRRVAMWECGCGSIPDPPRLGLLCPLRMDQRRAEQDSNTGTNPVSLYGEFTVTGNRKVRYAVSLTEKDLIVQRLTPTPVGRNKVVLSLKDCVGCRAYRGDDNADPAAYLAAYFYPFKRRWMSSGVSRQRVEQCFRLAALQDPRANLEEAEKWARAVRERSARQQYLRDGECWLATRGQSFLSVPSVHTCESDQWDKTGEYGKKDTNFSLGHKLRGWVYKIDVVPCWPQ